MAFSFGISVAPRVGSEFGLDATVHRNPYQATSATDLVAEWLPITFAVNSLSRAMGQGDLYPFILSEAVVAKLQYICSMVQNVRRALAFYVTLGLQTGSTAR